MKKIYRRGKVLLVVLVIAALVASVCACTMEGTDIQSPIQSATSGNVTEKESQTTKPMIANFNDTGYPIVNEPITLKVCGALGATTATWKGNNLFEHLTRVTGI